MIVCASSYLVVKRHNYQLYLALGILVCQQLTPVQCWVTEEVWHKTSFAPSCKVLNVVNAVFVQQTMKTASSDEELAFKQKEKDDDWDDEDRSPTGIHAFCLVPCAELVALVCQDTASYIRKVKHPGHLHHVPAR